MPKSISNDKGLVKVRRTGPSERAMALNGRRGRGAAEDHETRRRLSILMRKLRTEQGLSQGDVAALAGVSQGMISHLELGRRVGEISTVQQIFRVLGKKLTITVEDDDDPTDVPLASTTICAVADGTGGFCIRPPHGPTIFHDYRIAAPPLPGPLTGLRDALLDEDFGYDNP